MPALSFMERLREFLTSRRFAWIATIFFGVIVVLYFLFVTFFFNPFEDPLGDTASIVPRNVDYFVRWKAAGSRFSGFPKLAVWDDFAQSPVYERLEENGRLGAWGESTGIADLVQQLETESKKMPVGLSLERDLLREVCLTGRGTPALGRDFNGMIMLRVSFKVKAGVSMLDFGFVRDKIPGVGIESVGKQRYRIPQFGPFEGQDAFLTRIRDVVLLASRQEWLDLAQEIADRSGEGALGQASVFHDNVEAYLGSGDQPVEVFLRWESMRHELGTYPEAKPGAFTPTVLSRFFTTDFMRTFAGYWLPGVRFEGRFAGELDLSDASPFQRTWVESPGVGVNKIREFAGMVPADSFLFFSISGNPGRVFAQFHSALEEDMQRILDEIIVQTNQYQGMPHLLDEIGGAFSSGLFLAMRRDDYPLDPNRETEHDEQPVPLFAIMGTLRDEELFDDLLDFFKTHAYRFTDDTEDRPTLQSVQLYGNTSAIAFASPAIPGTGEILVMKLPTKRAILVANSFKYLEEIVKIAFIPDDEARGRKLSQRAGFREALASLKGGPSLLGYLDPQEARHWTDEFTIELAQRAFQSEMDAQYRQWRPAEESAVLQERFGVTPETASQEQLDAILETVDERLFARAEAQWAERSGELLEEARGPFLLAQVCDWLSLSLETDRRHASLLLTGRLDFD